MQSCKFLPQGYFKLIQYDYMNRFLPIGKNVSKRTLFRTGLILGSIIFSSWLMIHTFSYDSAQQRMIMAVQVWSDFGAHIPMIRSFSMGLNFPVEYPMFSGEPIRYHYLFYLVVGVLERIGFRIDWALNIPSIIGFAALLLVIYALTYELTKSRLAGLLTILFFLFNGSLSFLAFFEKFPLSFYTPLDVRSAMDFPSFAPWDDGDILAFWNLNIYTNQRHLAAAMAMGLAYILIFLRMDRISSWKSYPLAIITGLSVGLMPYFHQPMLLIAAAIFGVFLILFPKIWRYVLVAGITATVVTLPQLLLRQEAASAISFYPWFYLHDNITLQSFIWYWFQNIGLHVLYFPLGIAFGNWRLRKTLIIAVILFIVVNTFRFSIELAASHKFLNFAVLLGNISTAWFITYYVQKVRKLKFAALKASLLGYMGIFVFFLIFSGIIDFFVVANARTMSLDDIYANDAMAWIAENTMPDAVFANSTFLYNPASVAGRKVLLGWPYFAWSAGYDTYKRSDELVALFSTQDIDTLCYLIDRHHIDYIEVNKTTDIKEYVFQIDLYDQHLTKEYESEDGNLIYYSTSGSCSR